MIMINEKLKEILLILGDTSMSYSELKTKSGYRKESGGEFAFLLRKAMKLNFLFFHIESRMYSRGYWIKKLK